MCPFPDTYSANNFFWMWASYSSVNRSLLVGAGSFIAIPYIQAFINYRNYWIFFWSRLYKGLYLRSELIWMHTVIFWNSMGMFPVNTALALYHKWLSTVLSQSSSGIPLQKLLQTLLKTIPILRSEPRNIWCINYSLWHLILWKIIGGTKDRRHFQFW